jgi:putative transposase
MSQFGADVRDQVVNNLRSRQQAQGKLDRQTVDSAAEMLGVHVATVYRWINSGVPARQGRPPKLVVDDALESLAFEHQGNYTRMAAELRERGLEISRQSVMRAFRRSSPSGLIETAKHGERAMRKHQPVLELPNSYRNHSWQADCSELPILLDVPGHEDEKAWITAIIDSHTRAIMGYSVSLGSTTADSVLVALADAIRVTPDRGPFCGAPEQIVYDRGKQYLSQAVLQAQLLLGVAAAPTPGYMPEWKPRIERWFGTLKRELILQLPHATDGPKRVDKSLYSISGDLKLTLLELRAHLDEWVLDYNMRRAHSSLGDRTPLQAWEEDGTELRLIDDRELTFACMARKEYKVQQRGIKHKDKWYMAPELTGLVGHKADVRFMPHDPRSIEVFIGKEWLCRAKRHSDLTADELIRLQQFKRDSAKRISAARRRAKNTLRARVSPAAPGQPNEETLVVTAEEAGRELELVRTEQNEALADASLEVLPTEGEPLVYDPAEEEQWDLTDEASGASR